MCGVSAQGRVAVITGAGSGIGRAVTRVMLQDGYRVALAGRREPALRETLTEPHPPGSDQALVVPTDVTDSAAVAALFARVLDAWGRVDVLFNNAGRSAPRLRSRTTARRVARRRRHQPDRVLRMRPARRFGR